MQIAELCRRTVTSVPSNAKLGTVAEVMRHQHVGDVVVLDESAGAARPIGIVTDRDLVTAVLAQPVEAQSLRVGDLLGDTFVTCPATDDVFAAIALLSRHAIRRMPVVDDHGSLVGMVTADDLVAMLVEEIATLAAIPHDQRLLEHFTRP